MGRESRRENLRAANRGADEAGLVELRVAALAGRCRCPKKVRISPRRPRFPPLIAALFVTAAASNEGGGEPGAASVPYKIPRPARSGVYEVLGPHVAFQRRDRAEVLLRAGSPIRVQVGAQIFGFIDRLVREARGCP